ncbi:MAG: helix-turn-helix domain-containing protein [Bacteroidales bacterium]|nr:helix-turn-helix domain-containing protein [Bacteroidales bacterium]
MPNNDYNGINKLYTFELESVEELMALISRQVRDRRLERGLSREALSMMSGVPVSTLAKFEQKHVISLSQYVAIAKALGYSDQMKSLLAEPRYATQEELEQINRNKSRRRGRNEFNR